MKVLELNTEKIEIFTDFDLDGLYYRNIKQDILVKFKSMIEKVFYRESISVQILEKENKVLEVYLKVNKFRKKYHIQFNQLVCGGNEYLDIVSTKSDNYRFFYMNYPKCVTDLKDNLNSLDVKEVKDGTKLASLFKLLSISKKFINDVDKMRLESSFLTASLFSEHIVYIGGTKYVEFTKTNNYIGNTFPKHVSIVIYLKLIDQLLDNYYTVESNKRLEYLNAVNDVYKPYGSERKIDENIYQNHTNKIGLNSFTWFNNKVFETYIQRFNISRKLETISEESISRYQFRAVKNAHRLNVIVVILTFITTILALISILK